MVQFTGLYFVPIKILNYKARNVFKKGKTNNNLGKEKFNLFSKSKNKFFLSFPEKNLKKYPSLTSFFTFFITVFFGIFFLKNTSVAKNSYKFNVYSHTFYSKPVMTKIKTVPVFSVTNRFGQPFLIQNKHGEQVALMFFSHIEALEFGKELEKSHQATNPRIFIMGLDKAIKMISHGATSSGIKDQYGQDIKMRFQLIPDEKQFDHALNLTKIRGTQQSPPNIPIFSIPGLSIIKGKEKISPMFFTKEDLEITWDKIRRKNPDFEREPEIIEGDLISLIFYMTEGKGSINKRLNFGFVPPSESLAFVKKESKAEPSARMIF
mmetsp:Transcript_45444/g.113931  ORF Transcript_45444/g.113931 Transcript_45444/m.113931 type:complete len:321 (-) Transcript_45444:949-1911(-)